METTEVSYQVTATSHIGPVRYSITTEITGEENVLKYLAKGVLYEGQRIGASKAVKAMGGGKRANLEFSSENAILVELALKDVFGDDAEITTSEYVKVERADSKYVRANSILDSVKLAGGSFEKLANRIGFAGALEYSPDGELVRTIELLQAITKFQP